MKNNSDTSSYESDTSSYESDTSYEVTKKDILDHFMYYYLDYLNEIIKICKRYELRTKSNQDLGSIKITLLKTLSEKDNVLTIKTFIEKVLPYKKQIDTRNEDFFLENNNIYPEKYKNHIDFFKKLWINENGFSKKEKEICFKYFDKMLVYADKFKNYPHN